MLLLKLAPKKEFTLDIKKLFSVLLFGLDEDLLIIHYWQTSVWCRIRAEVRGQR